MAAITGSPFRAFNTYFSSYEFYLFIILVARSRLPLNLIFQSMTLKVPLEASCCKRLDTQQSRKKDVTKEVRINRFFAVKKVGHRIYPKTLNQSGVQSGAKLECTTIIVSRRGDNVVTRIVLSRSPHIARHIICASGSRSKSPTSELSRCQHNQIYVKKTWLSIIVHSIISARKICKEILRK